MMRRFTAGGCLVWLVVSGLLVGCYPPTESTDEKRDPHFQAGMTRKMSRDFLGAIEAFESALEANPRSAAAHYELGLIYYQSVHDHAAAIYHLEKYLKLRPNATQAQNLNEAIVVCKQELAKGVSLAIVSQEVYRQQNDLIHENQLLRSRLEGLSNELVMATNKFLLQLSQLTNAGSGPARAPTDVQGHSYSPRSPKPGTITVRTHTVKSGETLARIARQYGVSLTALQSANPRLNPHRLRVGQTVAIPGS